jgi:hypothetical protein
MLLWLVPAVSVLAVLLGLAFGPAVAGVRRRLLLAALVVGVIGQFMGWHGLVWFLLVWLSFLVGERLRRRLEFGPPRPPPDDFDPHGRYR